MQARKRRRVDRVALMLAPVAAAIAGGLGAAVGDQERVAFMGVLAQIGDDGGGRLTEVIDYDFGALATDKHGIYRDVPGLDQSSEAVQVSSETAPDDAQVTGERIRIGDPNQTVSGRHRYRISYRLDAVAPDGVLALNAVGTGWTVPIDETEIHVIGPFDWREPSCDKGGPGAFGGCDARVVEPGHIVIGTGRIGSGDGVTVRATSVGAVPTPDVPSLPPPPDDNSPPLAMPAGVAGAAALAAAVAASPLIRRAGAEQVGSGGPADAAYALPPPPNGMDPRSIGTARTADMNELEQMATIEFAPPSELTPAQGGIVLSETLRDEHKVAWLIDQASRGAIDLDDSDGDVELHWKGGNGAGVNPVLLEAFDSRPSVGLGSYDPAFSKGWSRLDRELEEWRGTSGLWIRGSDGRVVVARILGVLAFIVGLVATFFSAMFGQWVLSAVGAGIAGAGLAVVVRGWELRVRSAVGSGLWLRVESFRRFLAGSEAKHADWAAERGILREYTAWAVAVGEIDRWSRAVSASSLAQSTDATAVRFAVLAPHLGGATGSAATAPSSSGGGGGGGGVGGGAGGGGGGSW